MKPRLSRILAPVALLAAALCLIAPARAAAADATARLKAATARFERLRADPASVNRRDLWKALDAELAALARQAGSPAARAAILYQQAWAGEELAKRSVLDKDYETAVGLYATVATTAPGVYADDALLRRATILIDTLRRPDEARADLTRLLAGKPRKVVANRARSLLAGLGPQAPPAGAAKAQAGAKPATTAAKPPAQAQAAPAAAPPSATAARPATLESLAVTPTPGGTRLTLNLDRETSYRYQVLDQTRPGGEAVKRLYIDLDNTRTGPRLPSEKRFDSGNITRLRAGYFTPDTVRVVLELDGVAQNDLRAATSPFRLVLDLTGQGKSAPAERAPEHRAATTPAAPSGDAASPAAVSAWLGNVFGKGKIADPGPAPSGTRAKAHPADETRQPASPPPPDRQPRLNFKPGKEGRKQAGNLVEQFGLTVRTIMIDPGHGGKDPGATGLSGLVEKDVNLRFAKILGEVLRERGFKVLFTRTTDTFVPLEARTEMANAKGADLFVSLHCNAHNDPGSSGLETYSLNLASTQEAVRVAARENASSQKTVSDLQLILTDLMLSAKATESQDLAQYVQKRSLSALAGRVRDRGPHEAPFFVLIGANMPAVLVETGYLTNPADAKRLGNEASLRALAQGMADGIQAYKKKIERYATL